jgi:predicted nucleic acid-binding protein
MTTVVDASVVVAALVDRGERGAWAEPLAISEWAVAPQLLPVEVANALRRLVAAGLVSDDAASLAHRDLLDLPMGLVEYASVADRVWELRRTVTAYDACYVALAELLDAPLATLDVRLARAPGLRCQVITPAA